MLKIFVSLLLGSWGLKILNLYIENSAILNSIVFLYGIILVSSHVNYKRIINRWIERNYIIKNGKQKKKKYNVFWEDEIKENSFFPLIAGQTSFITRRTTVKNLKKYLEKDKNWIKTIDGIKIIEGK